jgi:hypothetical protein
MTAFDTSVLIAKLATLPILVSSLEFLYAPQVLSDHGLMSWAIFRVRAAWMCGGVTGRILDWLLSWSFVRPFLFIRMAIALAVLLGPWERTLNPFLFLPFAFIEWLFVLRSSYGKDGSDQLSWITVLTLMIMSFVPSAAVQRAGLYFLMFQVCQSYFVAGVAKSVAKNWWNGIYLTSIANMKTYGHPGAGIFLLEHRMVAIVVSGGVILWECLFPLLLLLPQPVPAIVLASGILFHLSTAIFMGLNCFFLAFTALYPALLFVACPGLL